MKKLVYIAIILALSCNNQKMEKPIYRYDYIEKRGFSHPLYMSEIYYKEDSSYRWGYLLKYLDSNFCITSKTTCKRFFEQKPDSFLYEAGFILKLPKDSNIHTCGADTIMKNRLFGSYYSKNIIVYTENYGQYRYTSIWRKEYCLITNILNLTYLNIKRKSKLYG